MITSQSFISVLHRQLLFQYNITSTVGVNVTHLMCVLCNYNALSLMPAPDFCCMTLSFSLAVHPVLHTQETLSVIFKVLVDTHLN